MSPSTLSAAIHHVSPQRACLYMTYPTGDSAPKLITFHASHLSPSKPSRHVDDYQDFLPDRLLLLQLFLNFLHPRIWHMCSLRYLGLKSTVYRTHNKPYKAFFQIRRRLQSIFLGPGRYVHRQDTLPYHRCYQLLRCSCCTDHSIRLLTTKYDIIC